ncbi:hypothetical protein N7517_001572 [Penicillium concentricum]|uniref:Uncharacterized protein n=1 Tax=Penicillium concentricum TaxID=293559 RepID=A0A9W9SSJ4_9EURO|nr:uncharacterized protein N7517_001572 [Penicillium concentricum]KAJ5383661.1 hypothetical protein N7517_001572 [Penicillium concentricum]
MNDQTYLSSGGDTTSDPSGAGINNTPQNVTIFGPGAGNVPRAIRNTFSPGWRKPSQINNPVAPGVDNVPQSIILFRPGGAHNTPRTTNNSLGHAGGIRITAPEIPTHDPDFLGEEEDGSDYETIDDILGDFDGEALLWEWRVEHEDEEPRTLSPGYFERLEAELDDLIAGRDPQQAEGSDSDQGDVPSVIEVEDIAIEARDSDEDTALDEA